MHLADLVNQLLAIGASVVVMALWVLSPRFERAVNRMIDKRQTPLVGRVKVIEDSIAERRVSDARLDETMQNLNRTLGRLSGAVEQLTRDVQTQGSAQAGLQSSVDTLLSDRRAATHDRRKRRA